MFWSRKDSGSQQCNAGSRKWRYITSIVLTLCVIFTGVFILIEPKIRQALADTNGPTLTVDATASRHAISPDIYGMNLYGLDENLAKELHLTVQRWGGNNTSRYNWLVDSSNAGDNYYYMGGGQVYMGGSNLYDNGGTPIAGQGVDHFATMAKNDGSNSLVTVPMIPYITKSYDRNCSYPKSLYPDQKAFDLNPNEALANGDVCGNGHDANGNHIEDTNIGLNNVANSVDFQKAWIQHLVSAHGTADQGGVSLYALDNEPGVWYDTHHDIHPAHTGYDELVNSSISYAAMIKQVDGSANVTGPADFGWLGYTGGLAPAGDDSAAHGGLTLSEYYLQQMHAYEQQHGVRLLNYFDQHFYPGNDTYCINLCSAGDATTQAARLESTRELWDPTYISPDFIGKQYGAIQLLPRFHGWINNNYPGTKLAITEYNFGGNESINGALTQADALGIFGREQVDLATMWGPPPANQPGAYAFRMYRNYDGNGSQFGDTWINSSSSDQGQLSVYGAQRASDGALTLMVINKTGNDLSSQLNLTGSNVTSDAQVYTYSGANLNAIVRQGDQGISANGFSRTYPANSITMVVIGAQATVAPTPQPTTTPGTALFATSFGANDPQPTWTSTVGPTGSLNVNGICCNIPGPEVKLNNEVSHNNDGNALLYSGNDDSAVNSYAYMKVFDLTPNNLTIGSNTMLDYWIYPQSQSLGLSFGNNSACVALDVVYLDSGGNEVHSRNAGLLDQTGAHLHPEWQCRTLKLDTWNHVYGNLGSVANGLKITRLDLGYDQAANTGGFRGYIDDVSIHN